MNFLEAFFEGEGENALSSKENFTIPSVAINTGLFLPQFTHT